MAEDQHPRDGSCNNKQTIKEIKGNDTMMTENATQSPPQKPHRKRICSLNDYENMQIGIYKVRSEKRSIRNAEKLTMSAHINVKDNFKFSDHSDIKAGLDKTDLRRASRKSNLTRKMSNHARKHVSSKISDMRKHEESNKKSMTLPPGQAPSIGNKPSCHIARNTRAQSDYVTKGRNHKGKKIQKKILTKTVSFDKNVQANYSETQKSENELSSVQGGRHKKNSSISSFVSEPFTFGEKNVIKTAHDSDITTSTRLEFKANVDNSLSSDNVFYDQDIPMHAAICGTLERHAVARVAKLDMKEGPFTEL